MVFILRMETIKLKRHYFNSVRGDEWRADKSSRFQSSKLHLLTHSLDGKQKAASKQRPTYSLQWSARFTTVSDEKAAEDL